LTHLALLIFNFIIFIINNDQFWLAAENLKLYASFVILVVKKKRSAEATERDQHTDSLAEAER
jgi:hypothetical protein